MTTSPGPKNPMLPQGSLITTGVTQPANVTGFADELPLLRTGLAPASGAFTHSLPAGADVAPRSPQSWAIDMR
jgi:hypothetical protein